MNPPAESLLKYDNPVLIRKSTDRKSQQGRPLKVSPQQVGEQSTPVPTPPKPKPTSTDTHKQEDEEILNAILPPREWTEGTQLWVQQVSSAPPTRTDVIHLEELLDTKLQQRQARLDELIRQVTIRCAERGLLLSRVRDEIQMTIPAYQTLNESSVAFGMRKALQSESKVDMEKKITDLDDEKLELKKQLNELKSQRDATEKRETEKRQIEEKKLVEEIQFLKRTNLQLKTQLELILTPKK
nr:axonemal dynein light intermediate polypeptide 1-like [Labrus bergylta]